MRAIRLACVVTRSSTDGRVEVEARNVEGLHINLRDCDLARDMAQAGQDAPGVPEPWNGDLVVSFELPDRVIGSFARSQRRVQLLDRLRRLTDDQVEKVDDAINALVYDEEGQRKGAVQ